MEKLWGNAYRTTTVCVDGCENGVLSGRLYNPAIPAGRQYRSLMELLLQMEDLLDSMQFPQPFTAPRSFRDPSERKAAALPEAEAPEGRCGTFAVRVLFRQNASWQGSVTWLEGQREESFRSVLELALLMNSALGAADPGPRRPQRNET